MKNLIFAVTLFFALGGNAAISGSGDPLLIENPECLIIAASAAVEPQASGCCSWHGGVCGCSSGRSRCCDGTLSPSCTCSSPPPPTTYTATAIAGPNGSINPATRTVSRGATTTFTLSPSSGYIAAAIGCGGTLSGAVYTTGTITSSCTVTATFLIETPISGAATILITHYYTSILGRDPDADGMLFWRSLIIEKQTQGESIQPVFREMAVQFFGSPEYLNNNTSNTEFITNLYRTFFQREPDQGGMDFWLKQLALGVNRDVVMGGFLYSNEFTAFMQGIGL
jgi:hypothetical protein